MQSKAQKRLGASTSPRSCELAPKHADNTTISKSLLSAKTHRLSQHCLHWFLGWIESEVSGGRRFLPEQTVQVGWSVLEIRQRNDGALGFLEPDFRSIPVRFVDSVSNTLLHLLVQKSAAESLGLAEISHC